MTGDANALLTIFQRLGSDIAAAIVQPTPYNQRLALTSVADKLDSTIANLNRSNEKYAPTFQPVAKQWCQVVREKLEQLTREVELRQELDNPYVLGVPLIREQEIFTGRTDIATRLEQLILDRRRPPLLLYGQRRQGKTSLLNNLGRLLPSSIVPLFIDLQGIAANAQTHAGFLYQVAKSITNAANKRSDINLQKLELPDLQTEPFITFDAWLDQLETALGDNTALLTLDEFETLDAAFNKGNLDDESILGLLRNLIQHRPKFKVLLSGSHTLQEFQRWASYLINAQTIEISYLTEPETRKLIATPIPDFALRYDPDAADRAYALTRGHPALTQLLCSEIVNLKNEQDPVVRRQATLTDINAAIPEALQSGSFFFLDLEGNQITAQGTIPGAAQLLRHLAAQGESIPSPDGETPAATLSHSALAQHFAENIVPSCPDANFDAALEICLRRDVIEAVADAADEPHYKFQVELIRRWFLQ